MVMAHVEKKSYIFLHMVMYIYLEYICEMDTDFLFHTTSFYIIYSIFS